MQGSISKLNEHLKGQHNGQEADFLKYDDRNNNCIYKNWTEFLIDPNIDLQLKDTMKIKRGKHQKTLFQLEKAIKPHDEEFSNIQINIKYLANDINEIPKNFD